MATSMARWPWLYVHCIRFNLLSTPTSSFKIKIFSLLSSPHVTSIQSPTYTAAAKIAGRWSLSLALTQVQVKYSRSALQLSHTTKHQLCVNALDGRLTQHHLSSHNANTLPLPLNASLAPQTPAEEALTSVQAPNAMPTSRVTSLEYP